MDEEAPANPDAPPPRVNATKLRLKRTGKSREHRSSRRHRRREGEGRDQHKDGCSSRGRHRDGEGDVEDRKDRRMRRRDGENGHKKYSGHGSRHRALPGRSRSRSPTQKHGSDPFHAWPISDPDAIDPDTAFRESLFAAMADDEGAAYWEGVYGQPVHIYAPLGSTSNEGAAGDLLERMTDEEYAAHVRERMWEKTHAGQVEARERRRREREEREVREEERRRVLAKVERSLRRGEERRMERVWMEKWEGYLGRWREWEAGGHDVDGIPWPAQRDVSDGVVRRFFVEGLKLAELGEREFASRLKEERVRWHPDKMQQRLGGRVEDGVMRDITAIFQSLDRLWNEVTAGR